MKNCLLSNVTLALAVLVVAFPAVAAEPSAPQSPPAALGIKSVTVFPIVLSSDKPLPLGMGKKIARVVGLFLERGGMKDIEIADTDFTPPPKGDLPKTAEAFGEFVGRQKIRTEYALYGQFSGTPGSGVSEIRLVVSDRQGKVVLSDLLSGDQLAGKDGAAVGKEKVDPMIASYLMFNRLRKPWGLVDPEEASAPAGKMAEFWDKDSGLPPQSEREAIERRLGELKGKLKTSTFAIFPVNVGGKTDQKVAGQLAEMLTKEGFGRAEAATAEPNLHVQGNTNELRVLWDTARAVQEFVRKNPPATDYVLYAQYFVGRSPDGKPAVDAVHVIVCDRGGQWVALYLVNSHHAEFQRIDPHSVDDCNRLVVELAKSRLR